MDETQFKEVEGIRKDLKAAKNDLHIKEDSIIDTRKRLSNRLIPLERELKLQETEMSKDQELRAKHDCTNQTDWKAKIKNKLIMDTPVYKEIQEVKTEHESLIKELEEAIRKLKIDISDMAWKLQIRLVYYK